MVVPAFRAPHEFVLQVRSALTHLYDYAYLQNHPLGVALMPAAGDQPMRAQHLRRILLDAMQRLCPPGTVDAPPEARRATAILRYRYIDALSIGEITAKLALGRRQVYREHAKAVEAVASLLWEDLQAAGHHAAASAPSTGNRLELAKTEVERLEESRSVETLNIVRLVAGLCDMLAPLRGPEQARVEMVLPEHDLFVAGDRTMLRQSLLSLLMYAINEAGDEPVSLAVRPDEGGCTIEVSAPISHKDEAGGMRREGVGLAVAKGLIEAQGGRLETAVESGAWRAAVRLTTSQTKTVLVIDDNAGLVSLFRRFAAGHMVSVVGAADAQQALKLFGELHPQLVLLDLMLPNRDGWEILQDLRQHPDIGRTPIVVCSVLNEPQLALAMGADDYLTKPVDQISFLASLERWIGLQHSSV